MASLFRKTCGQDWPRPKARLDLLAKHYGVAPDPARPEVVLFALQTWYVLLVKLLVGHVLAAARHCKSPVEEAVGSNGKQVIEALMEGSFFSALAVTDPWAGEPFDWFTRTWTNELEQVAISAVVRIAEYDPTTMIDSPRGRRRFAQAAVRNALSPHRASCPGRILYARLAGRARSRSGRILRPARSCGCSIRRAVRGRSCWRHCRGGRRRRVGQGSAASAGPP